MTFPRIFARRLGVALLMMPAAAMAQATVPAAPGSLSEPWRFTAAIGAWSARDALIISSNGANTTLAAGTAFTMDLAYDVARRVAIYGGGLFAASRVSPGNSIQGDAAGSSDRATVLAGTAGVVLAVPGGLLGRLEPTLRLGGGLKGYRFELGEGANQWRPVGDFGVGLRGPGGPLELQVEARYLASTIDQEKLPTRGIVPQRQRQGDLLLTVGVSLRP